jgi:hypothetical protein
VSRRDWLSDRDGAENWKSSSILKSSSSRKHSKAMSSKTMRSRILHTAENPEQRDDSKSQDMEKPPKAVTNTALINKKTLDCVAFPVVEDLFLLSPLAYANILCTVTTFLYYQNVHLKIAFWGPFPRLALPWTSADFLQIDFHFDIFEIYTILSTMFEFFPFTSFLCKVQHNLSKFSRRQ